MPPAARAVGGAAGGGGVQRAQLFEVRDAALDGGAVEDEAHEGECRLT